MGRASATVTGALLMSLASMPLASSPVASQESISVGLYLMPERKLCNGPGSFERCKKIQKDNFEPFFRSLQKYPNTSVALSPLINTREHISFFKKVRDYYMHRSAMEAVVLVFDLSGLNANSVKLVRYVENEEPFEGGAENPGQHYVTWYHAVYVDPDKDAKYKFFVDGKELEFEFEQ